MNSCGIPLNTIRQSLLLNEDCSCGIAAILESRRCSQMTLTGKLLKVKGKFMNRQIKLKYVLSKYLILKLSCYSPQFIWNT